MNSLQPTECRDQATDGVELVRKGIAVNVEVNVGYVVGMRVCRREAENIIDLYDLFVVGGWMTASR